MTSLVPFSVEELFALYEREGHRRYGEDVTALEHALQCAALADAAGAPRDLVCAALFHDVGWFTLDPATGDDTTSVAGHDHAALGARVLAPLFGADVAEPVALHVMAKRWRCSVDPDYFDQLSLASQVSFVAQGGPLTTDQRAHFETHSNFDTAMALRSWDDRAKTPGLDVPQLDDYRRMADEIARAHQRTSTSSATSAGAPRPTRSGERQ